MNAVLRARRETTGANARKPIAVKLTGARAAARKASDWLRLCAKGAAGLKRSCERIRVEFGTRSELEAEAARAVSSEQKHGADGQQRGGGGNTCG